jgi:plasmid stabilization system protein ParE
VSLPLIVNPEAEADLDEARRWYEAERTGLGDELIDAVGDVLQRVQQAPRLYAKVFQNLRLALVRRFPYLIVYRIDEDQITVVAVYHAHRDPRDWQSRA